MSRVKKLVFTAVCIALCVVLPLAFHAVQNGGQIFLPMHIPVLLCGLVCGWPWGMICGMLGPVLSSAITAMPPAPVLPSMTAELTVYGLVSGLMMRYVRTGHLTADLYISLISAMALGRFLSGLAKSLIFSPGTAPFAWVTTSLVTGIPGICIQLVLIPLLVCTLIRARLLPSRYAEGAQEIG